MEVINVKKIFPAKLDKIVEKRYGTRKDFIADYDNKFPHPKGVSIESLSKKWFAGSGLPTPQVIYNLSKLLNCDIDYLLTEQEEYKKEYKALSEFTNLSTTAAEELLEYTPLEIDVFNMFIARHNFKSVIQKAIEIASYKHHFGTVSILLSNSPEMVGMNEDELKDLKNYTTKHAVGDLLITALTNDIYNTLEVIIGDPIFGKRAREELFESIEKSSRKTHMTREEMGLPAPTKEYIKLPGE